MAYQIVKDPGSEEKYLRSQRGMVWEHNAGDAALDLLWELWDALALANGSDTLDDEQLERIEGLLALIGVLPVGCIVCNGQGTLRSGASCPLCGGHGKLKYKRDSIAVLPERGT